MSVVHENPMVVSHHFCEGVVLVLFEIASKLEPEDVGLDWDIVELDEWILCELISHPCSVIMVLLKLGLPIFQAIYACLG